jgi:hypothetical protein
MTLMVGISIAVAALASVFVAVTASCTRCRDGWNSSSIGRGTCSWHGGVDD